MYIDNLLLQHNVSIFLAIDKMDREAPKGDPTLRTVTWFHGKISRETAEKLVKQSGDFLVRESISQPGMYILQEWAVMCVYVLFNVVIQ